MKNQTKWSLDHAHSDITFKVRHMMIAHVKGSFKVFDASIYTYGNDFTTAEINLWIDASSVNTDDKERDEHLKGLEFFDVANHKQINFISSTIGKPDAYGNHELWGELTMAGVKQNVKLDVEFGGIVKDPQGNERAGFTLSGKINRSDWGLTWNTTIETGGFMVSDEVGISCEIELTNVGFKDLKMELENSKENTSL
jgi:polyisoprenoid-binding protein YceI